MNGRREAKEEGREGNISRHSRGQDNRNKRKYFFMHIHGQFKDFTEANSIISMFGDHTINMCSGTKISLCDFPCFMNHDGIRVPQCLQGRTKPWVIGSVAPFYKVPQVRQGFHDTQAHACMSSIGARTKIAHTTGESTIELTGKQITSCQGTCKQHPHFQHI